ncbi:MAG: AbrB/MazE/SpoVT family DNA-binding domain-containing protein [Cellulomonadaceae bacterium]|jgi:AbrB family looped-hinge helix DNA binding protein|nr:AbrB/MazE/SpoVT family DNA-binding domain-containing protein [Cellulomonadaceae bacterium]
MKAAIDAGGRILIPKQIRDELGLAPKARVDISVYGEGIQIVPQGRTATLKRNASGRFVAAGTEVITDDLMYGLIDAGRR